MATFSDLFTRAPETPLAGPNWEALTSGFTAAGLNLVSNSVSAPAGTGPCFNAVKTAAYSPSRTQLAECPLTTVNAGVGIGPACNLRTGSGTNGFTLTYDAFNGELLITRWTSNFEFYSIVANVAASVSASDVLRLECEDKGVADTLSLRMYKNGTQVGTEYTATFATAHGAGQIGLSGESGGTGVVDSFNGGDLTTAISGDLAATESGSDTLASTGSVGNNGIRLTLRDTDTGALAASLTGLIVSIRATSQATALLISAVTNETTDGSGVLEIASGSLGSIGTYVYVTVEKSDNSIVACYRVQVIDLNA